MGLIVVLDRHPLDEGFSAPASILKVFAARACVELERMRAERALRESMAERKLAAEQNEEMVRRLRALTARLESVREEEREHIAREIHDELGQQLTALRFDLNNLKNRLGDATTRSAPEAPVVTRPRPDGVQRLPMRQNHVRRRTLAGPGTRPRSEPGAARGSQRRERGDATWPRMPRMPRSAPDPALDPEVSTRLVSIWLPIA